MKTFAGMVRMLCVVSAMCCALIVTPDAAAQATGGACCLPPNGTCVLNTQCECDMQGGVWNGSGSVCVVGLCSPTVFGVCCNPAGCNRTCGSSVLRS